MEVKMRNFFKTVSVAMTFLLVSYSTLFAQTIEAGLKDLEAERFTAAKNKFDQLAASNPSAENYFYQGYALLRSPEANKAAVQEQAKAYFEKGNATDKKGDAMNMVGLGMVKYAQKDFAGAKLMFEEALKRTKGKDADVINRIGEAYVIFPWVNDPAEAIKYSDQAISVSKNKDNPYYFLNKANAYYIMNEGGDAMNALENAARLSNDKAMVYAKMGQIWLQGRNYEDAKIRLDQAVATDPTHAPAYKYLSSLYQIYQQFNKSAEMAELYLQNSDGDCGAKLRYAQLAFIGKAYDKVLQTVDEIRTCNDNPIVYRLAGISKFNLDSYQESIDLLNTYINKAPKEEVYGLDYGFIGRDYLKLDQPDKASEYFEKAYALKDTTYDYYSELADYYKEKKDYASAATAYEKVISKKKSPDGGDYFNVGSMYFFDKNYQKADVAFDKVVELYGDTWPTAYYYSALAKSLAAQSEGGDSNFVAADRYQKYLDSLSEADKTANASQVASAYIYLAGKSFEVDKNTDTAIMYVKEALKYDPQNERALQLLNDLMPSDATPSGTNGGKGK